MRGRLLWNPVVLAQVLYEVQVVLKRGSNWGGTSAQRVLSKGIAHV